ncbi:MAG TPA: hypothetical protein VGG64_02010 [Pirellulales bacterium]|jgi:hypothetical protein
MNVPSNLHGVIRGRIIELANDPGLGDGQEVEVTLRAAGRSACSPEGLLRSAGALANLWRPEDDEILDQIQAARARSIDREIPG